MDKNVIILVYNVENYLKRYVDSVLRQESLSLENILVDDGSTDSSGQMCNEYAACHSNIRYLNNNAGSANAKNKNYDMAQVIMLPS